MDFAIALTSTIAITCIAEFSLWMLFSRRVQPLSFPREFDTSYFRFSGTGRYRMLAIVHTIIVILCVCLFFFFLW